ncbi:MAG: hypothetical protein IPM29_15175 [Planctomycetes bacterium]|nr:hypothetical protein [Planctomycetota bacterium]
MSVRSQGIVHTAGMSVVVLGIAATFLAVAGSHAGVLPADRLGDRPELVRRSCLVAIVLLPIAGRHGVPLPCSRRTLRTEGGRSSVGGRHVDAQEIFGVGVGVGGHPGTDDDAYLAVWTDAGKRCSLLRSTTDAHFTSERDLLWIADVLQRALVAGRRHATDAGGSPAGLRREPAGRDRGPVP